MINESCVVEKIVTVLYWNNHYPNNEGLFIEHVHLLHSVSKKFLFFFSHKEIKMDNRYSPYDNSGFQRQQPPHQQPYVSQQHQPPPPPQQQQYRDDYGNNRRGGGGAMRDHQRGRRGHNNNNDHRPYNRKPNRQPGGSRSKNDDFDTDSASGNYYSERKDVK